MSEVLTKPLLTDETGQGILAKLDEIIAGLKPNAQGVSFDKTGCEIITANNAQDALKQLDSGLGDTNASLTYKSLASGSFKNTGTDYEYTGISFIIPQGKIAIVKVTTIWTSGKPKGLAITSTTANINTPIAANDTTNSSLAAISLTALLTAGTYYVWNKRETIPNAVNDYTVGGIVI